MDYEDPMPELEEACSEYRSRSEELCDDVLKWRYGQYESCVRRIRTSVEETEFSAWRSTRNSIVVKIIDLGIDNLRTAISNQDYHRVKIEADHIHNLPSHLVPGASKKTDYYLGVEVLYFLDLLESQYGGDVRSKAESQFGDCWVSLDEREGGKQMGTHHFGRNR
jgi:hypothetical protein